MKNELSAKEKRIFVEIPPMQAVLSLAVPTVLSQIINVVYNMADTYFIGRINNPMMIAGVTVCAPIMLLLTSFANLFGIGGASLVSRSLGEGKFNKAKNSASFAIWGSFVVLMAYSVILLLFEEPILRLFGAKDDTIIYCRAYVIWTCVVGGMPTVVSAVLSHLIRSEGSPKEASFGLAMGAVLNIILDPLFMFVLLPEGNEVAGAAIATMLSNVVSLAYFVVIIYRNRKTSVITIDPRNFKAGDRILADVISIGAPSFLLTTLACVSNAVVNNVISSASAEALAGMGIAKKINLLAFRVSTGITQGTLPLIAYNHAAKNYKRMKISIIRTAMLAVGFGFTWMSVCQLFGGTLVSFFIDDELTTQFGKNFIHIISIAQPLAATTLTAMMIFQASAQKVQATVLSVMRKGIMDIPLMFVFMHVWPLYGVACATPVAEVISAAVAVVMVVRFLKSTNSLSEVKN